MLDGGRRPVDNWQLSQAAGSTSHLSSGECEARSIFSLSYQMISSRTF